MNNPSDTQKIRPLTPEERALEAKYAINPDSSGNNSSGTKNFLAGIGNTIVNTGNAVPDTINWALHHLGYKGQGLYQSPQLQGNYDPNSLSYMGGQLAANIPLALGGGAAMDTIKAAREAPELLKAMSLGGATGYATNPEGDRGIGTLTGGIWGAGGNLAGQGLSKIAQNAYVNALVNKGRDIMGSTYGKMRGGMGQKLAEQIANVKKDLDTNNKTNYEMVWHNLSNNAGILPGMTAKDFPNYTKELNGLKNETLSPYISKIEDIPEKANDLKTDPVMENVQEAFGGAWPSEPGKINPQDVHFYKSALGKLGSGKNKSPEQYTYNVLNKALGKDLNDFLQNNNTEARKSYDYAQSYYKNTYAPFINHPATTKVSQQFNYKNLSNLDDNTIKHILTTSGWQGSTPSKLLNYIIPSKNDEDMAKFYGLGRLTTGEPRNIKPEWLEFARNKYMNEKTTNVGNEAVANTKNMLNNYEALTPDQKEMFFNPKEQVALDNLVQQSKVHPEKLTTRGWLSNAAKSLIGAGIGGAIGHHFPVAGATELGALGGGALFPSLTKSISGSIEKRLPQSLEELGPLLAKENPLKSLEKYAGRTAGALGATPIGKTPLLLLASLLGNP